MPAAGQQKVWLFVSLFLLLDPMEEGLRRTSSNSSSGARVKSLLGVHWPHPSFPPPFLGRRSLSFFLVVPELRMDHYVISRQAFNCFRDEGERGEGESGAGWHVRPSASNSAPYPISELWPGRGK